MPRGGPTALGQSGSPPRSLITGPSSNSGSPAAIFVDIRLPVGRKFLARTGRPGGVRLTAAGKLP